MFTPGSQISQNLTVRIFFQKRVTFEVLGLIAFMTVSLGVMALVVRNPRRRRLMDRMGRNEKHGDVFFFRDSKWRVENAKSYEFLITHDGSMGLVYYRYI